jgi:crotonobetainyl-CoA:carnitine CoA-transferase CaiB-like acyl-CoA transferase
MKPFAGVRILDFTRYVAGPFGTYQLALLGADVVKIEPKAGDDMRHSQLSKEWAAKGLGPSFMGINANKRSLTLDLQKPQAIDIVKRLAAGVDVERGTAAFDGKLQAMSGIMSITGHEDKGPTRAGFALCDTIGGMTAAFAVASALYQRRETGTGQFVDVSMLDAALSFLSGQVAEYTVTGHIHRQYGNLSSTGKVTGNRFKAGDGDLMLAVMTERQFANLMKTLGREDALADARFADWPSRAKHEPELRAIIEDALAADTARNWEKRLTGADVPCAGIWAISEIVHHPQLAHRDVLQHVDSADGPLTLVGSGFRLTHGGGAIDRPPPHIGEHSADILAEAGYDSAEIAAFRDAGVI